MRRALLTLGAISLLGGCSALGLSDDLDRAPCMACEELNAIEPPPDCMSWQCSTPDDPMNGVCELDLIDEDQDDAPTPMCATAERPADCDDADPANAPMGTEACDLADNDCDGAIDEDALTRSEQTLLDEPSLAALSFARSELELAAAYRGSSMSLRVARLPFDGAEATASTLTGTATTANPMQTAIARAGAGWVVAYSEGSGCSRLVLGAWSGSGTDLEAPSGHAADGLPKVGGSCAGTADTSEAGSPAIAATSARQALVAYLGQRATRACTDGATPVAIVAAKRAAETGPFTDYAPSATMVGQSVDAAPPALVAVSPAFGYLLAFADASGIGVHRVVVDGVTLAPTVSELYRESCSGACGDVSLTLAGDELGLAYRDGGCDSATATLRVLALDATAGTLTASGGLRTGETANGLRHPVAARRSAPDEWVLGWVVTVGTSRSVDAQRFDGDANPIGLPATLLSSTGAFPEPIALMAGTGADGYRAFAYDTGSTALRRGDAACLAAD